MEPRQIALPAGWELVTRDTFDRESSPVVEASGSRLVDGLQLLWSKTLAEGLTDEGSATFTDVTLHWRGERGTQSLHLHVAPTGNQELKRLRRWLGCHDSAGAAVPDPDRLLPALARAHAALLLERPTSVQGPRTNAELQRVLGLLTDSADARQLSSSLARLIVDARSSL